MDKQTALDLLDEKQDFLFSVSDSIWDNPETDYTETVFSGILMDALKKEGFTVTSGLAGIPTAFSGSYGSGSPVIGILGEFDALSGLSQKACATEKEALEPGGNGHGCGHCRKGISEGIEKSRNHHLFRLPCRGRRFRQGVYGQGRRI